MGCGSCGNPRAVDLSNTDFLSTCPLGKNRCSACEDIQELQRDIRKTSQKLITLLEKLETKKTAVNRAHSVLLNKLPEEIIAEVFRISHDGVPPCEVIRLWGSEEQRNSPKMHLSLRLAAVCQRWRTIALSSPHIWTDIHVPIHRQTNEASLDILKDMMQRSKNLPVSVSFFSDGVDDIVGWCEPNGLRRVFHQLGQGSARWHSLQICMPLPITNLFFSLIEDLSSVRSFHVHSNDKKSPKELASPKWGRTNNLKPQQISLNGLTHKKIAIQWSHITHITANDFSTKQITELLRSAPLLETYILNGVDETSRIPPSMLNSHFVHKNLRHITYQADHCYEDFNENFFSFNDFPALTSLEYEAFKSADEPLADCLERCVPNLLELRIFSSNLKSNYLIRLLDACHALTHFEFAPDPPDDEYDCYNITKVFERLAERNTTAAKNFPPFLPSLKNFIFTASSTWYFPWHRVPEFFGPVSDPNRRPLENFQLVISDESVVIPKCHMKKLLDLRRRGLGVRYYLHDKTDLFLESLKSHNLSE